MSRTGTGLALAVVTALAVAGCDQLPGAGPDYKGAVKRQLRDPASAQFSDVETKGGVACGFVNSKNGLGGYGGRIPFVASGLNEGDGVVRIIDDPRPADVELVRAVCPPDADAAIQAWLTQRTIELLGEGE